MFKHVGNLYLNLSYSISTAHVKRSPSVGLVVNLHSKELVPIYMYTNLQQKLCLHLKNLLLS